MNEIPKRFHVQILDMETSRLVDVETDNYLMVHGAEGGYAIRTERFDSKDAVTAMMSVKQLLYEQLKKEISSFRSGQSDKEFNALFHEVFTSMLRELLVDSIELEDGER